MDFNILNHFNKEEKHTVKKIISFKNKSFLTKFLSPREIEIYESIYKGKLFSFGGYKNSERKRIVNYNNNIRFDIACIKIKVNSKVTITHSMILGSLMGLSINRDLIGDIVIHNNINYFYCCKKISKFIETNLITIDKYNVSLEILSKLPNLTNEINVSEKRLFLKSLRLDSFISYVFNVSRNDCKKIILNEKCRVNSQIITKIHKELNLNDDISVRGLGKVVLKEIGSKSKSGRIKIDVEIYK